jgi:hypothetical protein
MSEYPFAKRVAFGQIDARFFTDCSGGNSSPSYPADAGGCIFFSGEVGWLPEDRWGRGVS